MPSVGVMKALFLLESYDCVLNVDDILPLETSRASAASTNLPQRMGLKPR